MFLLGIGASAVSILPTSILIGPFFSRWRGLAVGFINAGIGLGGFIAPRLATAQIAQRGLSGTFLVLAACMAIPFLLTLSSSDNNAAPRVRTASARVPTMPELARMPMFWIFGIALFFSAHAMLGVQQNLISYLTGAHVSAERSRADSGDCSRRRRARQTHQRHSGGPRQRPRRHDIQRDLRGARASSLCSTRLRSRT